MGSLERRSHWRAAARVGEMNNTTYILLSCVDKGFCDYAGCICGSVINYVPVQPLFWRIWGMWF